MFLFFFFFDRGTELWFLIIYFIRVTTDPSRLSLFDVVDPSGTVTKANILGVYFCRRDVLKYNSSELEPAQT